MAGMMSGSKGMGAAKMKGRFPPKKKRKGAPPPPPKKGEKESKAEDAGEPPMAEPAEDAADGPKASKIKKRMFSESY